MPMRAETQVPTLAQWIVPENGQFRGRYPNSRDDVMHFQVLARQNRTSGGKCYRGLLAAEFGN